MMYSVPCQDFSFTHNGKDIFRSEIVLCIIKKILLCNHRTIEKNYIEMKKNVCKQMMSSYTHVLQYTGCTSHDAKNNIYVILIAPKLSNSSHSAKISLIRFALKYFL